MATVTIRVRVTGDELDEGWGGDLTEYGASVEAALYEVQADSGMAYRPEVEHVPSARMQAATDLAAILDSYVCGDIGAALTCTESNALADFLDAWGNDSAAKSLRTAHAADDDEGDAHWTGQ